MGLKPPYGIYDLLIDSHMKDSLGRNPELRAVMGKLDPEEQPARYAAFLAKVIEEALRKEKDADIRFAICNHLIAFFQTGRTKIILQNKNSPFRKTSPFGGNPTPLQQVRHPQAPYFDHRKQPFYRFPQRAAACP